ncbi:MAG TPA: sterol desaturase family protein [Planctomycetota bacterium]|jgi:sterol desaturase/sphingolipid hydroxylase (fatty acid hydroxylase superfamily)|nr:sterol desaturase family protein [Planctomycetota bacterium]
MDIWGLAPLESMNRLLPESLGPQSYLFWLLLASVAVLILERLRPWRRSQSAVRAGVGQDVFWLFFNGHFGGALVAIASEQLLGRVAPGVQWLEGARLLTKWPLPAQFLVLFVVKDLLDWCVHNLFHRVSWLWEFHKVHHSITEMDWLGHMRFHMMELLGFRAVTYAPLVLLGAAPDVMLAVAALATLIGHLNHSNLNITWGPLRFIFNSPRMHIWHHAKQYPEHRPSGANFGISLSLWDWLFGTAWWPNASAAPTQQPAALGFADIEKYPTRLLPRFLHPIPRLFVNRKLSKSVTRRQASG